jgi:hypothetical protein
MDCLGTDGKYKHSDTQNYNFDCCVVWVRNLVAHFEGGTYAECIQSFTSPTNAQPICLKILKFTLIYTINVATCFGLTKPSSGNLQSVLR